MQRVLIGILLLCGSAASQSSLDESFEVPYGYEVSLWAESPMLFNPTAMTVDPRGRLWVTEAVNYRKWDGRNPGREHPEGDRVVISGRCALFLTGSIHL